MQGFLTTEKNSNNTLVIISINIGLFLLLMYSIFQLFSQTAISYYNNSWPLIFAVFCFIIFNCCLILSVRRIILVPNYTRNTQIATLVIMNFLILTQAFIFNLIQGIQSDYQSLLNPTALPTPIYPFMDSISMVSLFIFLILIPLTISDIILKVNDKTIHSLEENQLNSDKPHTIIYLFLNIIFLSLTIIFSNIYHYFNMKLTNYYNSNFLIPQSIIVFKEISSDLQIFSFIIFIVVSFLLIREFTLGITNRKAIFYLSIYDAFLFALIIIFNFYSSYFYSLEIILFFAFICVLFLIFFRIFIFNSKFFSSSNNLQMNYTKRGLWGWIIEKTTGGVMGSTSNDLEQSHSINHQPYIFINDHRNSFSPTNCAKCGTELSVNDKFCPNCGTRYYQNRPIL